MKCIYDNLDPVYRDEDGNCYDPNCLHCKGRALSKARKGIHHHHLTKKEMFEDMKSNSNPYDTFSYGQLLPIPTGIFRAYLKNYEEQIEQAVLNSILTNLDLENHS
jgi:hypothetical protein